MRKFYLQLVWLLCAGTGFAQNAPADGERDLGFTDTPILPGLRWHVHDPARPHAPLVKPSSMLSGAPSDAVVLFDGTSLSQWHGVQSDITHQGTAGTPQWKVVEGAMEVVPKAGDLESNQKFGDMQLHLEWASPAEVSGTSQGRGNSGIFLMNRFEVQVLDAWENPTYADGQAGAIYGQWPPLANVARKPGEWNTYDILFEAPRMDGDKLLTPAYVTVIYNGVVVQNHRAAMGPTIYRHVAQYVAQPDEDSIRLQNHGNAVRFRNIWVRRLSAGSDSK